MKAIKNPAEYEAALNRVLELWDAEPGTIEGDELDTLVDLIIDYEMINFI